MVPHVRHVLQCRTVYVSYIYSDLRWPHPEWSFVRRWRARCGSGLGKATLCSFGQHLIGKRTFLGACAIFLKNTPCDRHAFWHSWNEVPTDFVNNIELKACHTNRQISCLRLLDSVQLKRSALRWSMSFAPLSLVAFLLACRKTPLKNNPWHRHGPGPGAKVSVGPDSIKTWVKGQELWAWHLRGFEMADYLEESCRMFESTWSMVMPR